MIRPFHRALLLTALCLLFGVSPRRQTETVTAASKPVTVSISCGGAPRAVPLSGGAEDPENTPEPTPDPPPTPVPTPEPTPTPTPTPEPSPEPTYELSPSPAPGGEGPAEPEMPEVPVSAPEPRKYDRTKGYSAQRGGFLSRAKADAAPKRTTRNEKENRCRRLERWYRLRSPEGVIPEDEGVSTLFVCWCAERGELITAGVFPVTASSGTLTEELVKHGNERLPMEEYRGDSARTIHAGDLLLSPGSPSRAAIVTDSGSKEIQLLSCLPDGTLERTVISHADVRSGMALSGWEVITMNYPVVSDVAYRFCTEELGLKPPAACGILANMLVESGFRPDVWGDFGTSYGLCQWHEQRYDDLAAFCRERGAPIWSLETQLAMLKEDLNGTYIVLYEQLKALPFTPESAFIAAELFCRTYERPLNLERNIDVRGLTAQWTLLEEYVE